MEGPHKVTSYELTAPERFALNILLAKASEDGSKNNKIIFKNYHAGKLYMLILLKLFRPSNFTEEERQEKIKRLTVECRVGSAIK